MSLVMKSLLELGIKSCNGNDVYRESYVVTSNDYGLVNLLIGSSKVSEI